MLIYSFLFCIVLVRLAESDGFADKVYKTIQVQEGGACYRLFNGTHQYGCHGKKFIEKMMKYTENTKVALLPKISRNFGLRNYEKSCPLKTSKLFSEFPECAD